MNYSKTNIVRRRTKQINVGNIKIGSKHPITVQSKTNTDTKNTDSTIEQINNLMNAGADLVRVSCPNKESTDSLKKIIISRKNTTIFILKL